MFKRFNYMHALVVRIKLNKCLRKILYNISSNLSVNITLSFYFCALFLKKFESVLIISRHTKNILKILLHFLKKKSKYL